MPFFPLLHIRFSKNSNQHDNKDKIVQKDQQRMSTKFKAIAQDFHNLFQNYDFYVLWPMYRPIYSIHEPLHLSHSAYVFNPIPLKSHTI